MLGVEVVLGDRRSLTGCAVVQLEGAAWRLDARHLEATLARSPILRRLCLGHVRALLGQALQNAARNSLHQAEARLCRWFLLLVHDRADGDELPLTHEFLAEMLGLARRSVTGGRAGAPGAGPDPIPAEAGDGPRPGRARGRRVRVLRGDPRPLGAAPVRPSRVDERQAGCLAVPLDGKSRHHHRGRACPYFGHERVIPLTMVGPRRRSGQREGHGRTGRHLLRPRHCWERSRLEAEFMLHCSNTLRSRKSDFG